MTPRYVEVPFSAFDGLMSACGAVRALGARGEEIVYDRPHDRNPKLVVRIYSSFAIDAVTARACGEDAIRIALVVDGRGSWSATKVLRTGTVHGVLDRTRERMRECYSLASAILNGPRCPKCGYMTYPDSGKCLKLRDCSGRAVVQRPYISG